MTARSTAWASARCSSPVPACSDRPRDPAAARAVLRRAVELGVDHIDTSQYYGPDVVNDLIREALHPYPENLKLVTKVGWRRDPRGRALPAQRPDELRAGVDANLRSLRVERVDLVNLRLVGDGDGDGDGATVPLEEQLLALDDMRREGKLDLIGLSNVGEPDARRALELVDVAEIQNGYSVLDREDDGMVEFAREHEIAYAPFFPLGSSFMGGPGATGGRRGGRPGRREARGHAGPGRSRVAAAPLRPDAADPRHELAPPSRGEHGGDRARARRRRSRRPRSRRAPRRRRLTTSPASGDDRSPGSGRSWMPPGRGASALNPRRQAMTGDLGVWTADDCALVLIDYQKEMFEVIRSETSADLVELHVRLLARTAKAFDMPIVLSTVGVGYGLQRAHAPVDPVRAGRHRADRPDVDERVRR